MKNILTKKIKNSKIIRKKKMQMEISPFNKIRQESIKKYFRIFQIIFL